MSRDPLVVNTQDGSCWTRRAVTREGRGLYALAEVQGFVPDMVLAPLAELAEHGLSSMSMDALPVPAGSVPRPDLTDRIELIRRKRSHCEAAPLETEDERLPHVWGPSQYPTREMCQRCTVMREWAEDPEADEVVLLAEIDRLRAERHSTNEALDDAVRELRARRGDVKPDGITQRIAPTQALRELVVDGEHYALVHHAYRPGLGRDLPETGGTR